MPLQPLNEFQQKYTRSFDLSILATDVATTLGTLGVLGTASTPGTLPVAASMTVTVDTNANMADGNVVTICDGQRKVTYEYDKSANGVTAGNVNWGVGAGTAAQSATTLVTAITANQPGVIATNGGGTLGTVTVTSRWPGAGGNNTLSSCTSVGTLAVTQMSGGLDGVLGAASVPTTVGTLGVLGTADALGVAATSTFELLTLDTSERIDKVEIVNPTGFAGHATAYWTLALKQGTTTIASWSTLSSAESTITGHTPANMTLSATDANRICPGGGLLKLVLTKTSTPIPFPNGRIVIHSRSVA